MGDSYCDTCREYFVPLYDDDVYSDESGTYHAECHEEWLIASAREAGFRFASR